MEQRFCTKCGARLREGALFCNRCGNRVAAFEPDKEGTMLLVDQMKAFRQETPVKQGVICLTDAEKTLGTTKIVDFGTGQRFSVPIPAGTAEGKVIRVKGTHLIDPDQGIECEIELTVK